MGRGRGNAVRAGIPQRIRETGIAALLTAGGPPQLRGIPSAGIRLGSPYQFTKKFQAIAISMAKNAEKTELAKKTRKFRQPRTI